MLDKIIPDEPRIGIVVGTYGSLPYVHLQLEAWQRLYPECALLVHDDCSEQLQALNSLCGSYGADFAFTDTPRGHIFGDMCAFWRGLLWARNKQLDLLVKVSRRFICLADFRPSLIELARRTQAATYSNLCQTYNFGFRTEFMAMHVDSWLSQHQVEDFRRRNIERDMLGGLPEYFFHCWAQNIHPPCSSTDTGSEAYAVWSFMGENRQRKNENFLWHDSSRLGDYARLAQEWGLQYNGRDFRVN